MARILQLAVAVLLCTALFTDVTHADDQSRAVKVGETKIEFPASWKRQTPSNRLRLAQFEVPAVAGDKEPAELSIFAFGAGGTVAQQVQRWRGQFEPAGREFKGSRGKSELGEYVFVQLSGTYKKPNGPPILRRTVPMPGAKMLIMMVAVEGKGNYFFKLVGHDKTVAANSKVFREALGATKDEMPLKTE